MAQVFRALVVDDKRVFVEDFCEVLRERFDSVCGLDVNFAPCDSYGDARRLLYEARKVPYDIVFVDMMLPPVGDPDATEDLHVPFGVDIVGWAKQAGVPVVVGYSQASQEQLVTLERETREQGANRFFHRGQLCGPIAQARPAIAELGTLLAGDEMVGGGGATVPVSSDRAFAHDNRAVAVVHGRNERARRALFDFLRAVDLAPMEWEEAVARTGEVTPTISRILETLFTRAQAVVVLLTPDEKVQLVPELLTDGEDPEAGVQARPNVYFEAGMAFALYPGRTILAELGRVRPASDLLGRYVLRLDNSPECREALASRLGRAGCEVRRYGDWYRAGDFDNC